MVSGWLANLMYKYYFIVNNCVPMSNLSVFNIKLGIYITHTWNKWNSFHTDIFVLFTSRIEMRKSFKILSF